MFVSLRGGIHSLFDGGDYLSQITSAESVFISSPQIKRSQRYLSSYLCKDVRYIKLSKLQVPKKQTQAELKNTIEAHLYSCRGFFFFKHVNNISLINKYINNYIIEISQQPGNTFNYKKTYGTAWEDENWEAALTSTSAGDCKRM